MKRYLLFIPLLFCFIYTVNAQNTKGVVANGMDRYSGAIIKNLQNHTQTVSDNQGAFSIRVKNADTLVTTKPLFKTDTMIYIGQALIMVQLKHAVHDLDEVTIRSSLLTPKDIYEQNKKEYKDIYWKGDYSHMFGTSIGTMPGIAINIDKLYNLLSKQGKDARKMQRTLTRDYHDDVIDHLFTKDLVSNVTGYDGPKLDTFMMKYRPTYEFIAKSTEYDVRRYVKEKYELDLKAVKESEK